MKGWLTITVEVSSWFALLDKGNKRMAWGLFDQLFQAMTI